mmetsp:Transcript_26723/g.50232  ORF Transcript_26723/g.50232 Transcript_26723/m.50232 type:complete len:122 (-) Transcript_26723:251-616(-)
MAPPGAAHPNLTVGGLLAAGGAYGYYKAGSVPSLLGGGVSGALMVASGMMVEKDPQAAFLLGGATSGILSAGMGRNFLVSRKVMPTGMVTFLGIMAFAYNCMQLRKWWSPEELPFIGKAMA